MKPISINGKPYTDAKAQRTWRAWEHSLYTPGMRVEDGENYDDLITRAEKALALLTDRAEPSIVVGDAWILLTDDCGAGDLGEALSGDILSISTRWLPWKILG